MKGRRKNVKTKVDTSKRVNEPRMKPSSAKYLPFFVPERDPSTYLHTIRERTHIYDRRKWVRATPTSGVSHSLLGEIAFRGPRVPAFQELSRWPWSVTPVGEHLLPHPPLSPRGLSLYFDLSHPPHPLTIPVPSLAASLISTPLKPLWTVFDTEPKASTRVRTNGYVQAP